MFWPSGHGGELRFKPKWLAIGAVALGGGTLTGGFTPGGDEVGFLDVGQGDCTMIRDGSGAVLIDVGPKSPTFDSGERKVLPKLRQRGVRSVEAILLTHPDLDHIGGLASVYERFPEATVMVSQQFHKSAKMVEALQRARIPESHIKWLPHTSSFRFGDFDFKVYAPVWPENLGDNEGSLFVLVQSSGSRLVVSGDANSTTEKTISAEGDWHADVMHTGHHGSKNSTGEAWLKAVNPRAAIISCGVDNRYGHPHASTLDKLSQRKVDVYRTDLQGDIFAEPSPIGFKFEKQPSP